MSQGGACMKIPMGNSRSYFKATAVWNRREEEDKEKWEEEEGKKNEENHYVPQCTSIDIKTEMPIAPGIWVHKGKLPGSTRNLCCFLHIWSHQSKCPEAVIKHTCQRAENSNIPEDWTTLSANLTTNKVKTQEWGSRQNANTAPIRYIATEFSPLWSLTSRQVTHPYK